MDDSCGGDFLQRRLNPPCSATYDREILNQQWLSRHQAMERWIDGINWGTPRLDGDDPRDHSYSCASWLHSPCRGGGM